MGYRGANQLRLTLPSSSFDNLLSRAPGAMDLAGRTGGYGYGPMAYLSPSRTVLSPAGIAGGRQILASSYASVLR